ncbi:MAG: hypothetical protein E6J71_29700, partial [Deltaproteobacteria bacterium]
SWTRTSRPRPRSSSGASSTFSSGPRRSTRRPSARRRARPARPSTGRSGRSSRGRACRSSSAPTTARTAASSTRPCSSSPRAPGRSRSRPIARPRCSHSRSGCRWRSSRIGSGGGFPGSARGPRVRARGSSRSCCRTGARCTSRPSSATTSWTPASPGAEVIVTLSNDSWFSAGPGPRLHLVGAAFLSIETRRPQLRATNTGISAVIAPTGEVLDALGVDQRGTLVATVRPEIQATTLMVAWGDWLGPTALGGGFVLLAAAVARRPRAPTP